MNLNLKCKFKPRIEIKPKVYISKPKLVEESVIIITTAIKNKNNPRKIGSDAK